MILYEDIKKIYDKLKNTKGGKNASYIKELAKVNPNLYAISIYTIDGQQIDIGDYKHEFAIESCSKIFTLALALEKHNVSYIKKHIGEQSSKEKFNSICAVDYISNHTINAFDNAGAMATTSLLYKPNKVQYINSIVSNMSDFAGRKLHVNQKIYNAEISEIDRNLAIAHLLKSHGRFYNDVDKCVDAYTKQCSVMVTSQDVAVMACTLANNGVNPKTGARLVSKKNTEYIIQHMHLNGLYDGTDVWRDEIGVPMKSGISGILLLVVPGVMGISIISPPLNAQSNSVKGMKTAKLIHKLL